jgi:hypothetical protein
MTRTARFKCWMIALMMLSFLVSIISLGLDISNLGEGSQRNKNASVFFGFVLVITQGLIVLLCYACENPRRRKADLDDADFEMVDAQKNTAKLEDDTNVPNNRTKISTTLEDV